MSHESVKLVCMHLTHTRHVNDIQRLFKNSRYTGYAWTGVLCTLGIACAASYATGGEVATLLGGGKDKKK